MVVGRNETSSKLKLEPPPQVVEPVECPTCMARWLDVAGQWDKYLSRPIQHLELGVLEYVLMVPGTWFGLPSMYVTVCATMVALAADPSWDWAVYVCLPVFFAMLFVYSQVVVLKRWSTKWLRSWGDFGYLAVICVLSRWSSDKAIQAQLMFALAMLAAQLPTIMLKIYWRRLRPVVADAHLLDTRKISRLLGIHLHVDTPREARESFPSGDAVGAGVFYGVLACTLTPIWVLPVVVTLFGRVYFWAHHVGDVSVGCGIGLTISYLVYVFVGETVLTIWHFFGSLLPFLLAYSGLSKYRGKIHPRDELAKVHM